MENFSCFWWRHISAGMCGGDWPWHDDVTFSTIAIRLGFRAGAAAAMP